MENSTLDATERQGTETARSCNALAESFLTWATEAHSATFRELYDTARGKAADADIVGLVEQANRDYESGATLQSSEALRRFTEGALYREKLLRRMAMLEFIIEDAKKGELDFDDADTSRYLVEHLSGKAMLLHAA